jgi:hypothetical protein
MPEEVKLKPLTKMQVEFVKFHEGNNTDAARKAKFANPEVAGAKLMRLPQVRAAVATKQAAAEAATKAAIVAAGKERGTGIGKSITRGMLAERAWEVAQAPADNMGMYTSQVNAMKFLGELLKYTGDQEGEVKNGIIQRPDGAVEVYQSKWIKQQTIEHSPGN